MEEKELVEYLAKRLVDKPDAVSINVVEDEKGVVLELTVDPDDVGKVIGKRGRIAHALRTLLSASGIKTGRRVALDIIDN